LPAGPGLYKYTVMVTDTAELIDAAIMQLQTLQDVLAEDFQLCRRTGLSGDAVICGAALEAISVLLPRLERARSAQELEMGRYASIRCRNCD
jgi:hypothetical protein